MVVSEPPDDDQMANCEDVGTAYVSVKDILKSSKDITDQDIEGKLGLSMLTLPPLQTSLVQSKRMNGRVHCSYLVLKG